MAPEQLRSQALFASDLYSLGVTCLHLLTQTSPFDLFDINENNWAWRDFLTTPISDKLGEILDKMVQMAVNHRYQSIVDVLQDLNQVGGAINQNSQANVGELELFSIGGKFGYKDDDGQVVISPQFDDASHFREGLEAVKLGDKWGYIDNTGRVVISPQFNWTFQFREGLAKVQIGDKWGYIDKTGQVVIPLQFDNTFGFYEGLVAVNIGDKWGYIDKTGQIVIPLQFDKTYLFNEGFAAVNIGDKYGYIDKTGQVVIPLN